MSVERISMVEGSFKAFLGIVIGGSTWMIMTAGHVQSPYERSNYKEVETVLNSVGNSFHP